MAVTIDSFNYTENFPELAANKRPIWVVDAGPGAIPATPRRPPRSARPGAGRPHYVNTWALGPLAPGGDADVPLAGRSR